MTFQFRPAVRTATTLLVGIGGPSGSGKTYSALLLAKGLAGGKPTVMIDTESGRGLHYADKFDYQYCKLEAPFGPDRYLEAIRDAHQAGAGCIIVDSMSHAHEGPGGLLEMHDTILTRMAGADFKRREQCTFSAWIEPKKQHNLFMNGVLQVATHIIFCFRAKDKMALVKNERGKMEPVSLGWQPICSDRFEYEMTTLLMLPPRSKGAPDLSASATKIPEQFDAVIRQGRPIDTELGEQFAAWAVGSGAVSQSTVQASPLDDARAAASGGKDAFTDWWNGPGKAHRAAVRPHMADLQAIAQQADGEDEEDPFGAGTGRRTDPDPITPEDWQAFVGPAKTTPEPPPATEPLDPGEPQAQPAESAGPIPEGLDRRDSRSPVEWAKSAETLKANLRQCGSIEAYRTLTKSQMWINTLSAMNAAGATDRANEVAEAQEAKRLELEKADG